MMSDKRLRRAWWIGGLVGLAFGIVPLGRANADDAETRASRMEALVLAKNRGIALVAKHEMGLWAEQHRKLVALVRSHPQGLGAAEITAWQAPLSAHIKEGAARASDAAVVAIWSTRLALLQKLQSVSPEACKSYVDVDLPRLTQLAPALKDQLKAADQPMYEAYEQGVGRPALTLLTAAQADAAMVRLQNETGILLSKTDLQSMGGNGSAADVCDSMVRYVKVLVQAPANESAPVIRFLMLQ